MNKNWEPAPLGELLKRSEKVGNINPLGTYKQVTVRLWGRGVILRDEVSGSEISATKRYEVKPGQFILSKIDARNGAFGLVPSDLDGAVVSGDFPVFDVNLDRLEPKYLEWKSKTGEFVDLCRVASEGTTNRVRLKEDKFLRLKFLLPPLPEQQRIVTKIEVLAARIVEARRLRLQSSRDADSLFLSALNHVFKKGVGKPDLDHVESPLSILKKQKESHSNKDDNYNNAHPHAPKIYTDGLFEIPKGWIWTDLGSVLSHLVDCVNDTPDFSNIDTGFIGLKSTNIRPYKFDLSQRWYVTPDDCSRWNRRQTPRAGDIILTREAPMGYACILPSGVDVCLTQRLLLLRTDQQFIENKYILHYINSPHFQNQILEDCRGLTTPHIRVKDAPFFLIPLPPKEEQRRIVAYLDGLQAQVDALKKLQTQTAAELDALLPAVLDRAFKGEL